ncbi:MAG TPA: metalloregulator ArsR/SmtB family transcription factor [Usitatibacter sp.]|nr:metalloregulator ArsR/SmtB family transcription factor [Usitatibacter sp.]
MLGKLDDTALEEVARYFAALSVPVRLKILNALRQSAHNVTELTELTQSTQANVSKHLAVLSASGLVARHPEGTNVYYRIADPKVFDMCDLVCDQLGRRFNQRTAWQRLFSAAGGEAPKAKRAGRR